MNAVKTIDRRTVEHMKLAGDPGLILRRDKKTGEPVLYVWQLFGLYRLDYRQMRTLARYIREVVAREKSRTKTKQRKRTAR